MLLVTLSSLMLCLLTEDAVGNTVVPDVVPPNSEDAADNTGIPNVVCPKIPNKFDHYLSFLLSQKPASVAYYRTVFRVRNLPYLTQSHMRQAPNC